MPCLDDATALKLAQGELDPGSLDAAIEHIGDCESCRVLVAAAATSSSDRERAPAGTGELPDRIGRFAIVGVAGHGAMGVVYRGHDERLDRPVAIKVIRPALLDTDAQRRLEREARALAKVDHPAVVGVYEVGDVDGSLFVAMEWVDGGTLGAWLTAEPRSPAAIVAKFVQGGEGLLAAHQAGLVHRDFKPANAMLDERGDVHVTDFGLVSGGEPEPSHWTGVPTDLALTQTGAVVGTPAYMSPEQLQARPADPRSDQFSFCVALFEALAGHRPFEAATYPALLDAVLSGRPSPPARPIPPRVHRALLRGLAPQPQDRFPSMRELLDELARPRRRGWAGWVAGAVVIAGIAFGVAGPFGRGGTRSSTPTPAGQAAQAPPAEPTSTQPGELEPTPTEPGELDPCTTLTARWSSVWNEDRKQAIRDHEEAKWPEHPPPGTKPELAERWEGVGRVNATFSVDDVRRFGETWRSLVEATCSDSGSPDSATARLRRRCLAGALDRLDAIVERPPTNRKFRDAVAEVRATLPRCSTHLVESLSLPDGEAGELVAEARAKLSKAESARWDGDFEHATALAREAIELAEQAGDPTALAEAWLEHGRSVGDSTHGDVPPDERALDALDSLHEALSFAQQASHHRVIRESSDELAWRYAFRADDPRQARRWLDSAARLDAKIEPTTTETMRRDLARARVARLEDDHDAAIAQLRALVHGDPRLDPALAPIALTEWALVLNTADPAAIPAMLDDFEARYSLEPTVLEAVERVRAVVEGESNSG